MGGILAARPASGLYGVALTPIAPGRHAIGAEEAPGEMALIGKAQCSRDASRRFTGAQQPLRLAQPELHEPSMRRQPELAAEDAQQMEPADPGDAGEIRQRYVAR